MAAMALIGVTLLSSCVTVKTGAGSPRRNRAEVTESAAVSSSTSMACMRPDFYITGPKIRQKMLELIDGAKDYILIDSFLTVTDPVTVEVLEALAKKHRAGVRIYVIADSSSRFIRPGVDGLRYLNEVGIPTAEFNPLRVYKLLAAPVMLPRDHRKFWIVDGKVLFLGGANITATSLTPPEQGGNHDFMVAVESAEAIESMIDSFVRTWNGSSRSPLRTGDFHVLATPSQEARLWLFDQNRHGQSESVILPMFDNLFSAAEENVWLIQPYTFVTDGLLDKIRELTGRGVDVKIMLSGDVQAGRFHYASFYGIKDILEAGGEVWVYREGMGPLHSKVVVVDQRLASVGSANLNHRSFHLSNEANVVFDDRNSVHEVLQTIESLKRDCRQVTLEEAERYRSPDYHLRWLWMQWAG